MRKALVFIALFVTVGTLLATPEDAEMSEERARSAFIDQFTKFMQNKNIQGRPKGPDGKPSAPGKKTRFNQDDGLAFQSDLTYHDYAFITTEKTGGQGGNANGNADDKGQTRELYAWVSGHGGVGAAGGSSLLERTAYQLDKKFTQQDQQNKNQKAEPGIRYKSIFKVTTKEVFDQAAQNGNNAKNANEDDKQKVDRYELRDEAQKEITKVGETASETLVGAAKGEANKDDKQALANGVYLRGAANDATNALWNATLSNLSQRRINRAIRAGGMPSPPQVSEGVPKCEEWGQVALGVINQAGLPPEQAQARQQDIQRMMQQCKQVAATPYNAVNPQFTKQGQGDNQQETLQSQGPQKEDAFQRDARIQLELMAKAGKSVSQIPSNWQFTQKDEKARMTIGYDDNQPKEGSQTIREQLDSYNENLKASEQAYQDVAKRIPGLRVPKPTDFAIVPGTRSLMDINKVPDSALEEVGIQKSAPTGPVPQNYDQLVKAAQTN